MKRYCEFEARLESLEKVKKFLSDQLVEDNIGKDVTFDLMVTIEEVFTNIVKYGLEKRQADKITIQLKVDTEKVKAEIIDTGRAFNPLSLSDPDLDVPLEDRKPGGLGIYLVKELMDEVHYRRFQNGNILTLRKNLSVNREEKE
jgi:anti-sigma regulatory factor (Ser/Thr protein kinase)